MYLQYGVDMCICNIYLQYGDNIYLQYGDDIYLQYGDDFL